MHEELLAEYRIRLARSTPGSHKGLCPRCSHTRRHKRDPCLSVRIDDQGIAWNCFNCGWCGGAGPRGRSALSRGARWNW